MRVHAGSIAYPPALQRISVLAVTQLLVNTVCMFLALVFPALSGSGRSGRNPSKCHNSGRSSYPEGVGKVQSYTHYQGTNKSPCQHSAVILHE